MTTDAVAGRDPVEELAEEFMARLRRGERPSLSAYAAAHPHLADEIRDLFPALLVLEEVKPAGTDPPAPAGPDLPPARLGDYRILREVARGGMGVVYEAEQVALGRHVALKVLPAHPGGDALRLLRFRREARSAAKLHHTNIVPVFDVGSADGVHYYAMQFIQGQGLDEVLGELRRLRAGDRPTDAPADALTQSLADGLRSGVFAAAPIVPVPRPVDPPRSEPSAILTGPAGHYLRSVARLGVQAADALAYAHGLRVLHRDVKPSNLLLDRQGTLWLTDFGLAKDDGDDLTRTGDIVGTLRYMAPERFQGVSDPRADVYALGVTLYEMLTLRPAFPETDRVQLVRQIARDDPPKPRAVDPTIPRDLETIVLKAIEKEPGRRYPTAADLADDLRRFLADRPIRARRASWREQGWRWCRRNPAVAGSLASALLLLVLLAAGLSVGTVLVWRAKGEAEAALADEKQAAYFQRIALADRELAANNLARAEELLTLCPPPLREWEWHYLNRSRGKPPPLLRHPRPLNGRGSLRPDGRRLAVGGVDGTVALWDLEAMRSLPDIPAHAGPCCVAYSPDGRFLASADARTEEDAEVKLWDPQTGTLLHRWTFPHGAVERLAFSPDGERLAVAGCRWGEPLRVDVWAAADGRHLAAAEGDFTPEGFHGLTFSPDGRLVAAASTDATVRVFDGHTGRVVHLFRHDRRTGHLFWSVAFSPDGRRLAAGYGHEANAATGGVRIWDVGSGAVVGDLIGQMAMGLAFGPGGRLAAGGPDGTVRLWDPDRGQEVLTLRGHLNVVWTVGFTPDGHRLVTAGEDRAVRVWDGTPVAPDDRLGDERLTLTGHTNGVNALDFDPVGRVLATAGTDGTVRRWDVAAGYAPAGVLATRYTAALGVSFPPAGGGLAVAGDDGPAAAVDQQTGTPVRTFPAGPGESVTRLRYSPDGRLLAGFDNRTIFVWPAGGGAVRRLPGHNQFVYGVAFGTVGGRLLLASVSTAGEVRVWDPDAGEAVKAFDHDAACAVAFRPDGRRLATAGWDRVVRVWDTATWTVAESYRDPTGGPNALAFSPDGKLLAWGGTDATVKVWRLGTDEVVTLRGHRNWVWDVAFHPAGTDIVSAGRDGTVKVWTNPFK